MGRGCNHLGRNGIAGALATIGARKSERWSAGASPAGWTGEDARPHTGVPTRASAHVASLPLLPEFASFTLNRMSTTGERFERAVQIMARLRAPGGCPWDREQTFDTIKPYTLEETYEVLEAIDNRDWPELTGELGDLLLQVLFYSQMASEEGHFSVDDVLDRLSNKLMDRHPHVFGDVKADTPADVLRNWEALKAQEKAKKKRLAPSGGKNGENADDAERVDAQSVLAGVSSKMPALMEAYKLSSRAANVGFDWAEIEGLFAKLEEETVELREELKAVPTLSSDGQSAGKGIAGSGKPQIPPELRERLEDEVGDLFFVLVNIARYLALDPESALRKTNRKFKRRFQWMEERLRASGRAPQQASMDELESLWQQAKQQEKLA
jgi:nucleoside triphosphate diphosphatase